MESDFCLQKLLHLTDRIADTWFQRYTRHILEDISIKLLQITASCCLPQDCQVFCATTVVSALSTTLDDTELRDLLCCYLQTSDKVVIELTPVAHMFCVEDLEKFKASLCCGVLQSKVAYVFMDNVPSTRVLLALLGQLCMSYSRMSCLGFKMLVTWMEKILFSKSKQGLPSRDMKTIFHIINSNWDNPMHGVREHNSRIFELFLDVCLIHSIEDPSFIPSQHLMDIVTREQPWQARSKYCVLTVLLQRYGVKRVSKL